MTISPVHFLIGATKDIIKGGSAMAIRRALVIHFTAGATGKSSIESMRKNGLSAHLVVERSGFIWQCRPFNLTCGHAGVSRWRDPNTGKLYKQANGFSIGIEIANAGNDSGALSWARKQPGFKSIKAKHRNGGKLVEWEAFYEPQLKAIFEASQALVARYNLDDITGHDCIAPERKTDPGPAFDIKALRESCGFAGLPVVHWP